MTWDPAMRALVASAVLCLGTSAFGFLTGFSAARHYLRDERVKRRVIVRGALAAVWPQGIALCGLAVLYSYVKTLDTSDGGAGLLWNGIAAGMLATILLEAFLRSPARGRAFVVTFLERGVTKVGAQHQLNEERLRLINGNATERGNALSRVWTAQQS